MDLAFDELVLAGVGILVVVFLYRTLVMAGKAIGSAENFPTSKKKKEDQEGE